MLLIASNDTELELNADKTKFMDISLCQNTGRIQNFKHVNSSFDRVK